VVPSIDVNNEPFSTETKTFHQEVATTGTVAAEPVWVHDSRVAMEKGDMKLCQTGVGGTYLVSKGDEIIAVFKPVDEEPGAENNPKKKMIEPILPPGKGASREVAAYLLDKQSFVGVPETFLIKAKTPMGIKSGSLQKFVNNIGDCNDMGANKFSVENVHKIGVFDVRTLNMDRNDENLIIQTNNSNEYTLVPIDHTYCFPEKIDPYFNWQFWSQAKKPFSQETLKYINSIDVLEDANMLTNVGIDEKSIRNIIASDLLLIKMANSGKTLFQIAKAVSGKENKLLQIVDEVEKNLKIQLQNNNTTNNNNNNNNNDFNTDIKDINNHHFIDMTTQQRLEQFRLFKEEVERVLNSTTYIQD